MIKPTHEVESALLGKGFLQDNSHHKYFIYHSLSGKKTMARTKTSHGSDDLDDYLLGEMARQCFLTKKQFLDLVNCPMQRPQYEAALTARGKLP